MSANDDIGNMYANDDTASPPYARTGILGEPAPARSAPTPGSHATTLPATADAATE